jgi:hypothetical protein
MRGDRRMNFCKICGDEIDQEGNIFICPACRKGPCRHGQKQGECDHCDHEADLAFDAERERR